VDEEENGLHGLQRLSGPGAWVGRLRKRKRIGPIGGLGRKHSVPSRKIEILLQFLFSNFEFETKV
jgi:hypothetical protein